MDPRIIEEERKKRAAKVAQSQATATPIQPAQHAPPPGQMGQSQSPLAGIGMQIGKKLLGGMLGGLFNEGGYVKGYNQGGWLQSIWGGGNKKPQKRSKPLPEWYKQSGSRRYTSSDAPRAISAGNTNRALTRLDNDRASALANRNATAWNNLKGAFGFNEGGKVDRHPQATGMGYAMRNRPKSKSSGGRTKTDRWEGFGKEIFKGIGRLQDKYLKRNEGGMVGPLGNPYGYNEGGAVAETPMKRVMDEQKLDQQAVSFELDEARKEEKHRLDMKLKQQQFQQAQQMKKAAATTNKQPKAPLSK